MAEVVADLDWVLREASGEATVPHRPESKQKSNMGGDDEELPSQGNSRCLRRNAGRYQNFSASSEWLQSFLQKTEQLISTS